MTTTMPSAAARSARHRLLAGFALMPSTAAADAAADADLIRLCDRLVAIEAAEHRLCFGPDVRPYPGDDPVIGQQLDALDAEREAIMSRLATMRPATLAGVRALGRVVSCLTESDDHFGLQQVSERERALRSLLEWLATGDGSAQAWMPQQARMPAAVALPGRI